jgi:hypothetical protein
MKMEPSIGLLGMLEKTGNGGGSIQTASDDVVW